MRNPTKPTRAILSPPRLFLCLSLFWSLLSAAGAWAACREVNVAGSFPSPAYAAQVDATVL